MSGTLRLKGSTSGYSELQAPAVAGDQTFTLPAVGGDLLTTDNPAPYLTLESGVVTAPSLTFEGDSNTGIYSPGANEVAITTSGTERLKVDSNGNVGIGTDIPGAKLDVKGGSVIVQHNAGNSITLKTSVDNGNDSTFLFQKSRGGLGAITDVINGDDLGTISFGGYYSGAFQNNSTIRAEAVISGSYGDKILYDSDEHLIRTNNATRIAVTSGGNVGIGTSSPSTQFVVSNSGAEGFEVGPTINSNVTLTAYNRSTSAFEPMNLRSNQITFSAINGSEAMRIDSSGNVGIGTTNPGGRLEVKRDGTGSIIQIWRSNLGTNNRNVTFYSPDTDSTTEPFYWNTGNSFAWQIDGSERMRIDSTGNVGIGTSNPGAPLAINTPAGTDAAISLNEGTTTNPLIIEQSSAEARIQTKATQPLVLAGQGGAGSTSDIRFETRDNERMRIGDGGNIYIHTTTNFPGVGNTATGAVFEKSTDGTTLFVSRGSSLAAYFNKNIDGQLVRFLRSGNQVGSISVTTSNTSFNTSSDYRLKENVVDLDGAIDRVKQLAPKRFNFIVDADTTVDGFLAHEAQAVVPEAVTGTHNEVDDDGNAVIQGIDQSKLVPLLTAALQEAIAKIETLETKVAALEAG